MSLGTILLIAEMHSRGWRRDSEPEGGATARRCALSSARRHRKPRPLGLIPPPLEAWTVQLRAKPSAASAPHHELAEERLSAGSAPRPRRDRRAACRGARGLPAPSAAPVPARPRCSCRASGLRGQRALAALGDPHLRRAARAATAPGDVMATGCLPDRRRALCRYPEASSPCRNGR